MKTLTTFADTAYFALLAPGAEVPPGQPRVGHVALVTADRSAVAMAWTEEVDLQQMPDDAEELKNHGRTWDARVGDLLLAVRDGPSGMSYMQPLRCSRPSTQLRSALEVVAGIVAAQKDPVGVRLEAYFSTTLGVPDDGCQPPTVSAWLYQDGTLEVNGSSEGPVPMHTLSPDHVLSRPIPENALVP